MGMYTSIAMDSGYKAHISYYEPNSRDLMYATNASGSWQYVTLDSANNVGLYTSLALDGDGKVHISYHDFTSQVLKYVSVCP